MRIFYFIYKDNSDEDTIGKYRNYFRNIDVDNIELVTFDRIHEFLSKDIKCIDENSLFMIPAILDSFNAYTYDGVETALRIYFHHVINRRSNFRIVILGSEEKDAFWEHCRYSNILKCPHVDFTTNNIFSIKDYLSNLKPINSIIDWGVCIDNLKKLNIQQPASYKSHHSITNEWSIYRWSKYLGIQNIEIQKEIEEFLYFNFLKAVYPESIIPNLEQFILLQKGKILLIDDETDKGWHVFFKSICAGPNITFNSIGGNFKRLTQEEIIKESIDKIRTYDPNVIILDLRLHDKDYDINNPKELTGARIFNSIKEFNKGIQIIIFSASNKVWNYLPFASDGIILKESPEMSMLSGYTQESISNLRRTIQNCLDKNFLKEVYVKIKQIKNLLNESNCFGEKTEELVGSIDVAFDLLVKGFDESEYFAYAYLQLFIIIENYANLNTVFKNTGDSLYLLNGTERYRILKDRNENKGIVEYKSVINYNDNKSYILKRGSYKRPHIETSFLVSALLIFKFGESTSNVRNWGKIISIRNNKAAHPKKEEVTTKDIDMIIDFMSFFFDDKNAKWRPLSDAFREISIEEEVSLLQEKYGNLTTNT